MDRSLLTRGPARLRVVAAILFVSGCGFYTPKVSDCTLRCGSDGACPLGTVCAGGFCQTDSAEAACQCLAGEERSCGQNVGECRVGSQRCGTEGAWGECVGEVRPTAEVCDGKDNDCDGLIDQGPVVDLVDDLSSSWRLHGTDGGYALVHSRAADGGEALLVTWLDAQLLPVGTSGPLWTSPKASTDSAAAGDRVYVAFATEDGGLRVTGATADGRLMTLAGVPRADRPHDLHLGASEQIVANWLTTTTPPHARLARWHLDGGLDRVVDLDSVDAGRLGVNIDGCNLSMQGHVSVYIADPSKAAAAYVDAGVDTMRFVQNTSTLEVMRVDAPYFGESEGRVIEQPNGAVTSTYTYVYPPESWSGVFFSPDLRTLTLYEEKTLDESRAGANLWGDSDATLDRDGHVAIVYMDLGNQRLVVARSVGNGVTAEVPARRPLQSSDGYGTPRVAQSGDDVMLAVAWANGSRISARRVCGAR